MMNIILQAWNVMLGYNTLPIITIRWATGNHRALHDLWKHWPTRLYLFDGFTFHKCHKRRYNAIPFWTKHYNSIPPHDYHIVAFSNRYDILDLISDLCIYSISHEICTQFCCALLCCGYAIVHNEFTWSIYPYSSGLLCWHWGNR